MSKIDEIFKSAGREQPQHLKRARGNTQPLATEKGNSNKGNSGDKRTVVNDTKKTVSKTDEIFKAAGREVPQHLSSNHSNYVNSRLFGNQKETQYSKETKTTYDTVKNKVNSKTTVTSSLSESDRKKRIREINSELGTLDKVMSGYSRAGAYGTGNAMKEAKKKTEARIAELRAELKTLERTGTFTASELKQFEIEDAAAEVAKYTNEQNSYGQRPSADEAEAYRETIANKFAAQQKLDNLKREKKLYDDITEYSDVVNEDNNKSSLIGDEYPQWAKNADAYFQDFESQWRANYRSNELSREADKAMSKYMDNPTEENKQIAYTYAALAKAYMQNNEKALDDENVKASWLSKSLAGYLPQFKDQIVPEIIGGGVGGLVGAYFGMPDKGAAVGAGLATGIQSYGVVRGSVYRTLLEEGVDEETARSAANDEALISSLIEGGETALSVLLSGGGKAISAIGNAAKSSVAKGSTNAATKFVANLATKASTKATSKAASKVAAEVARPLWNKGLRIAGGIAANGASEYLEEFSQGAVSEANKRRALSGNPVEGKGQLIKDTGKVLADVATGKDNKTLAELHEQGMEGFKIGLMMGGSNTVINNVVTLYANAKTTQQQNEAVDAIIADEEILDILIDDGKASGGVSAKFAEEIEIARENGKDITRNQVKKLIASTEAYKATEQPDSLEKAARDVTRERSVTASRPATVFDVPTLGELTNNRTSPKIVTVEEAKQVTGFGDNGAELVTVIANTNGTPFTQVAIDVMPSYMAGFNNPDLDIKKVAHTFTSQAQEDAYTAGQKDSIMQSSEAAAKANNIRVFGEESGVVKNIHSTQYTPEQIKMSDTIGKDTGTQVSFEERLLANEETGSYANAWHQNGEIKRANDSGNKFIEDIMEESLHRISEVDTEAARVLMRSAYAFVAERERSLGVEGRSFYRQKALYDNAGERINTRGISEEVSVGFLATELFKDEKQWLKWRERLDADPELRTAWQKLGDAIAKIIEKIRRLLAEGSFSKETRAKVNKDLETLERFRNLYGEAYKATRDAVAEKTNEVKAKTESKATEKTETRTEAKTATITEATEQPTTKENKSVNKETTPKAKSKPETARKSVKVGETYTANATGKTYTVTERTDTDTTYTVTAKNGKTTTRTVKNSAADANFNRKGKEGFTKVEGSKGIKAGDVFTSDKETYKIVSRGEINTIVQITSEEGKRYMVISNEIADRNFSNMSPEGITKWIDEADHIDNRDWDDVGDRKVKAFQYLFPEMQEYYKPLARELIGDLDSTTQGERMQIGSYEANNQEWIGVKRFTSDAIATIKDSTNATYDDIRNALNRLIEDEGQENIALAKRIELVFDDMLTKGYKTFEGMEIPPNEEYITKKEALIGKEYEKYEASEWDEDLPFFSLKDNKKTDTNSTKNLEIKINEEYNGSGRYSLKWRTDLNRTEYKQVEKWIRQAGTPEAKRITDTACWYKGRLNGETIFAIYSTEVSSAPTILYERRGKEGKAELDILLTQLEEIENGRSIVELSKDINTLLSGDWLQEKHNLANNNAGLGGRGSNTGYAPILQGKSSKFIGSQAFRNVVKNIFDIQEKAEASIEEGLNGSKRYSLKDSTGKTLTKAQQEYFKDSKVRDENGNLLVMYHGTSQGGFTVFDTYAYYSKFGLFGNGAYFTDNKDIAEQYTRKGKGKSPQVYSSYLNITNPIDMDAKANIEAWNKALQKTGEDFSLLEGEITNEQAFKSMVEDLEYAEVYSYDAAEIVRNVFEDMRYDGITHIGGGRVNQSNGTKHRVFIAFEQEQIKDINNANPTSNPDIRFSLKKPVEQTKNLVAVHNVWEHKLRQAFELGGLPSPSIAITNKDFSHENFGEISLLFRKDTISPTDRRNKVYGGDAYTPTKREIDYKISDKALDKISEKIKGLVGKDIRSAFHLSLDSGNVEFDLKRADGNFVEAYKQNETLKIAYLNEKGIPFKPVMKTKELSQYADNIVLRRVSRAIGEDTLKKASSDSKVALAQEPMIRKLLNDRMEEQGAPRIYGEQLSGNELFSIIDGALSYISQGETKTVDYYATRDRLNNKFTKKLTAEYEKWLAELGEGIIEKKGIRNDRDLFTPSGSRRSFEALHWDYTLENIVKSMNGQQSKGSAMWGGNVFGASTKEYSSIAEIKADSSRLQEMTDEEYEALKSEYKDRLNDIAEAYSNGKSVYDAEDALIEAIATKKTKQGVKSYLAQYDYVYKVTDDIVNDLWELRNDISQMPVSYFEAKPQRAVGWNEVVAAVIPKKTDKSLKTELENRGIKVIEYDKGKDGERLKKINSVPDINFSLKGKDVPIMEYLDTLEGVQKGKKKAISKLAKYAEEGLIRTEEYDALIEKYGIIPSGERPHREIFVPAKTAKGKKVSMTVRTILEAEVTPDTAVPTIEKMVEDGVFSYDVYTDKEAIKNSETYIKAHGWNQTLVDWFDAVNSGEVSKDLTTTGWALYNNAATKAATETDAEAKKEAAETAVMILDAMVRHQRSAAQALQATRILKKMSPEAQLYGVQRSVESLQNELKDKYGKKAPELEINETLAEKFLNAKTEEERLEAEKEIYKDIGRQMPSNFMDKWNAWRYLAMLGNLRTHGRNILGNAFFAPVVATKNLAATTIESIVAPVVGFSGKKMLRGKKFLFGNKADRALLKAAWNDYANVADAVSNGGKYNDSSMANKYIEEGKKTFKSKLFAPVEWLNKKNSKALETEDVWFSKPHYAYALAMYCKANNITPEQIQRGKAIAPAREYAINEARKATYKDTNAVSQFVSSLGRTHTKKNAVTKTASAVVEGILPFRKTPANILVRGVEYSPLGLVKGLTRDLYKVSKGEMHAYEAIDNISAGLTGTVLLALGVYLAAQGLIRGHGEDEEKEKEFNEMMGHQAYSLELPNGQSITLDWLAPEALPFFVGVNIWETTKGTDEKVNMSSLLSAVTRITEPMLEMSCLQGLNDLIEGVGYASANDTSGIMAVLSSAVTSYLTQGIPTLFGQAERTGEENRMTTYTEKDDFLTGDMQYTLGKMSAKIPFWDYNQIPYIDAWGRNEASGTALKRGLNNFLNPAYTSTIASSDMEKELLRLYEQTGEGSVFPSRADKKFTVDGVDKHLTADEYVRYATLKGENSYTLVSELVASEAYRKLSDEEKVKAIEEAYDYANQKAKKAISNYKPQSWVGKADEFEDPENYLTFRASVSATREANDNKITKPQVVDIILDTAENDAEIWEMYLSEYDSEEALKAKDNGVDGKSFVEYSAEVSKAGEDGSLKKEEVVDVIAGMDIDNDDAWSLYLGKYDEESAIAAEKHGIDAKLYMTARVDMGSIQADYNYNGKRVDGATLTKAEKKNAKQIKNSRRAKIEKYLNKECDSYKEYLFLLGTEYSSIKDDHDYVKYFGKE